MDWTIWTALTVAWLAMLAAAIFVVVRSLQGWRALKRFRRHLGKELERLADTLELATHAVDRATDTHKLDRSLERLRIGLAQLTILRDAFEEATEPLARLASIYARK
jgi:hypothetical protein